MSDDRQIHHGKETEANEIRAKLDAVETEITRSALAFFHADVAMRRASQQLRDACAERESLVYQLDSISMPPIAGGRSV